VYRYLYSKLRPPLVDQSLAPGLAGGTVKNGANAVKAPVLIGAPHACEIEYCMGNLALITEYAWTADDFKVSGTMQDYFANFIKTGNPNGNGLPQWDAAGALDATPQVMIIDVESKQVKADNDARYLFLDKAYRNN
jgi:para-nitrobenzyl esterase